MEHPSQSERLTDASSVFDSADAHFFGSADTRDIEQSPLARQAFLASLAKHPEPGIDPYDAAVVLSEGVGNAFRYGGGLVGVWWGRDDQGRFCIAVFDRNTDVQTLPDPHEVTAERWHIDAEVSAPEVVDEQQLISNLIDRLGVAAAPDSGRGLSIVTQYGFTYRREPTQLIKDGELEQVMATFFCATSDADVQPNEPLAHPSL